MGGGQAAKRETDPGPGWGWELGDQPQGKDGAPGQCSEGLSGKNQGVSVSHRVSEE